MIEIEHDGIFFTMEVFMERMQLRIYEEMWGGAEPWDSHIKRWRKEIARRLRKVRALKRRHKNFAR